MSVAQRAMATGTKKAYKFTFSDYSLAYMVRGTMEETLVAFDADHNQLFDRQEIKHALVEILHENENQLHYVVNNVFRYDRNNDGHITYKQFIDFSVEQHFGEMAIQRLHKLKTYSQGHRRIMNVKEFIATLEYALNTIGVQVAHQVYEHLFKEVDLDQDGFISYEDYFVFLREYFGSESRAPPPPPVPPKPQPSGRFEVDGDAAQRFARLIYTQLKITAMQVDYNRNLFLEPSDVQRFVSQLFQADEADMQQILELAFRNEQSLDYQNFLQFIVPFYFCEYYVGVTGLTNEHTINLQLFLRIVTDAASAIVAVPPSEKVICSLFHLVMGGGDGEMTLQDYVRLMGTIFQNYNFDKRGLPRHQ